jgi:lipopolysaccharide export LptBFGC system permease protein LptF
MVLGFCVQLIGKGLDVVRLWRLPYYIFLYSLPWVLPSALLTAVIMAFGRLSADKEILAIQVGGGHLFHIMMPVYTLALLLAMGVTFVHFELAPRADHKIEVLKSEAVREILKDQIALSGKKQFYFKPCLVQYESYEYEDGRMVNPLILELDNEGALRTVITAGEGEIVQDPEHPEFINIVLSGCAVNQLADEGMGGPGTWEARRITLPIKVGEDPETFSDDIEHLSFRKLWARYKDLTEEVSSHAERFRNPDETADMASDRISVIDATRSEISKSLRNARAVKKALVEKLEAVRYNLAENRQRLESLKSLKDDLQRQQVEHLKELDSLQQGDGKKGEDIYSRIRELQSKLDSVRVKLEEVQQDIEDAQKTMAESESRISRYQDEIKRQEWQIEELAAEVENLQEERSGWHTIWAQAETQDDLRELKIRSHRRLALAFAVLFFAVLGMPLGIMTEKRSTLTAFSVGFGIMLLIYYPFLIIGQIAAETGLLGVVPALWSGDVVILCIGLVLTAWLFQR